VTLRVLGWQAAQGELTLVGLEVEGLGGFGKVREEHEAEDCHGNGNDAVDDEGLSVLFSKSR
jgi:hypothetical protein